MVYRFYTTFKAINPGAYTVGEVFGTGGFIATAYMGQLDSLFNFELACEIVMSASSESNPGINSALKITIKEKDNGNCASFIANHDQNRVMSALDG